MLCDVEGDDAARVVILAGEQILDHGFQIGFAVIHLAPHAAGFEVIGDQIYSGLCSVGTIDGVKSALCMSELS